MKTFLLALTCIMVYASGCSDSKLFGKKDDKKDKTTAPAADSEEPAEQAEGDAVGEAAAEAAAPVEEAPAEENVTDSPEAPAGDESPVEEAPAEGMEEAAEEAAMPEEKPMPEVPPYDWSMAPTYCADKFPADAIGIAISGDEDVTLVDGAVLILEVSGDQSLDLSSDDVAQLGGLCVVMGGDASFTLKAEIPVGALYFDGQGQVEGNFDFGDNGSLITLGADVTGGSVLEVEGKNLVCDDFVPQLKGSAQFICNGNKS